MKTPTLAALSSSVVVVKKNKKITKFITNTNKKGI